MTLKLQDKHFSWILAVLTITGLVLRLLPGLWAGFPLNDGGMFLSMVRDLRANHFLLPLFTSYNHADFPFAYPPLGFYVGAFFASVFHIPEIEILRWLPPLVAAAIIPAFHRLSLQISGSHPKALVAAAVFTFLPGASDWLIMGGGLTRSLGILFSLLAFSSVYQLFRNGRKHIIPSILFCALTVLSHPEVELQTAGLCFLLWLFFGRSMGGTKNALLVGLGTALLTSPWWLTVLLRHGSAPFESAMQTGVRETLLASLFHSVFSLQGGLPILPILGLAGTVTLIRKREFLLVVWALLPFVIDPRNAPAVANYPWVLLAVEGLYFLAQELDRAYARTLKKENIVVPSWLKNVILAGLLLFFFAVSYSSLAGLVRMSLTASDRDTMEWVKANTPAGSRFLLLTNQGEISPMTDSFQEWFPTLTERRSVNTLQGMEWTLGSRFYPYTQELVALQSCADTDCLHTWAQRNHAEYDYLLLQTQQASKALLQSLRGDGRFHVLHESESAVVFSMTEK